MIYTINDIEEGDSVVLIYDKDKILQVTWVSDTQDHFQAMDWTDREIWTRLNSDDIHKLIKAHLPLKSKHHESTNELKYKSRRVPARMGR